MILLALPIAMQVKGEVSNKVLDKYVAIGDEISMEADNDYDVAYVSLINDGITSSDLLNIIEENKEKIKDSDLITVSIGGNNILNAILANLNIDETILQGCDEEKFDSIISEYLNSDEIKSEILNKSFLNFKKDSGNVLK